MIAGNSDGHAKNLSLVYRENNEIELSPFYDLVCTRAFESIDKKLALSVGAQFDPGKIHLKNWYQLALDCDVRRQYLIKLIQEMMVGIQENLSNVQQEFESSFDHYPALQRIEKVITKQCRQTNLYLN